EEFPRLAEFYAHPPTEEGIARAVGQLGQDSTSRATLVEVLREQNLRLGSDGVSAGNLDRLARGAVAVVTGQQVGLFTGPSYSIYKALSAIRIASRLRERGTDAVPVFWLAGEDHDLVEVNHCFWLGRSGLTRFEIPAGDAVGRRVGEIQLGERIREVVLAAAALLDGPSAEAIGRALEASYRPEETLGSAFGKLVARVFAGKGIILLDPLDARLHRLAIPVYRRALAESAELTRELLARTKALDRSGYHAQVRVTERNTLLFMNVDGQRLPVRQRSSGFVVGRAEFSSTELLDAIDRAPEAFSANVLLRPVVQDALLPTAVYIGGPAEVAYFAQAEVIYRRLLGRMPAVLPRASFTLVEPHIARLLKKHHLELPDVLCGRQRLRAKMEREFVPKGLAQRFDAGEKALGALLRGFRRPLSKLDKTLLGALSTAERKMLHQFRSMRGKAARAVNLRTGVLDAHERQLTDALYPHRGLQERTLCFLPMLARHGDTLLDELAERSSLGATQHQVVFL
ncbi:MAG TPA: bacillithiol biosynthesis cysteine-adding enzyme BshC, partial [Candidatus Acidoferrales bacterium]|nr:bacillithiol biosynthesis cysteine-adding enzyme BshC [Candidatus Acidoferrales bacterium]